MGTTLTGTTPQDTYDSLIKVTDNGPLSGSLKKLTDGLGNDSALSLSTTAASLSGTLGVGGDVKLGTATTGTPSANADDLVIDKGASESGITIISTAAATLRFGDAANTSIGSIEYDHSGDYMRFNTSGSEKVRILSSGGITFNGDTAAANALSDYEQGTFTAQLIPTTSGSITLNASYTSFFYTKIGRQVMVSGTAIVSSVSSPVGNVRLEGLPFTSNSATSNIQAVNIQYYDNSATFIFAAAYMGNNVSRITTSIDASTVAAGDEIYFTHTYNV